MNEITQFSDSQIQLLMDTVCKGATENEFQLFVYACNRLRLDPFARQIHAIKRWDNTLGRHSMTIQVGIDGYRLIAERTGCYAPGKESVFHYCSEGRLVSCTAYVKKKTSDGTWHEVAATAFFSEYAQSNKNGSLNSMWAKMPHSQLAKCAESLALRKAFPAELSGTYTDEEMQQAEVLDDVEVKKDEPAKIEHTPSKKPSATDLKLIKKLLDDCSSDFVEAEKKRASTEIKDMDMTEFNSLYRRAQEHIIQKLKNSENQHVKPIVSIAKFEEALIQDAKSIFSYPTVEGA